MTEETRTKLALAQRRHQVAELYLQGWSQMAIGEHLHVAQSTVSADIRAVQKEWRTAGIRNFDLAREMELRKLDRLEREAWAAWERSRKPSQSAVITGGTEKKQERRAVKHQHGDGRPHGGRIALRDQCREPALAAAEST